MSGRGPRPGLGALLVTATLAACTGTGPSPPGRDFQVEVAGETFVMRTTDTETIRLARENAEGDDSRFPIGPLRPGDGGFNAPWTWHLDPAETRMVEAAIEICDGRPSYVEKHQEDYSTYCPWGANVTRVLR